jgi:hemoglobin-like flavoprotein
LSVSQHPEIRAMFPLMMGEHQEHVFVSLVRLVRSMDSSAGLREYAGRLGRDHRKFGVQEKHYQGFFDALLATVQFFNGPSWTMVRETKRSLARRSAARFIHHDPPRISAADLHG